MTSHRPFPDDPQLDEAWCAVVQEDAADTAPPHLEQRLLTTLTAPPAPRRETRVAATAWLATAATFALIFVLERTSGPRVAERFQPSASHATAPAVSLPTPLPIAATPDRAPTAPASPPTSPPATSRPARSVVLHTARFRLSADPIGDTEAVHVVRLRLPRAALEALGAGLIRPDAGDVIEVDVLIGEDGVAREMRRVPPEQE